jgi:hypothetical protein
LYDVSGKAQGMFFVFHDLGVVAQGTYFFNCVLLNMASGYGLKCYSLQPRNLSQDVFPVSQLVRTPEFTVATPGLLTKALRKILSLGLHSFDASH